MSNCDYDQAAKNSQFIEFDSGLHSSIRKNLERCPTNMSPLQHVGYTFEVVVALALSKAGAKAIFANPLREVEQWTRQEGLGVDIVLPDEGIIIEVKNNDGTYWITPAMIWKHVLSRFLRTDPDHQKKWLAVLAHNKLSVRAGRLLARHRVIVVVAGRSATKRSMASLVKILAKKLREVLYDATLFTANDDLLALGDEPSRHPSRIQHLLAKVLAFAGLLKPPWRDFTLQTPKHRSKNYDRN